MQQKTNIVGVRLTPTEKSIFVDAAKRLGMSLAGLLREAALQLVHREMLAQGHQQDGEAAGRE